MTEPSERMDASRDGWSANVMSGLQTDNVPMPDNESKRTRPSSLPESFSQTETHNHCSCIRMRRFRDSLACIYSTEPSSFLSICDIKSQPAKRPFSWPSRFDSKIRFGASLFHFIYGFSFSNGRAHFLRIERVWRGITWRLDKGHTFRQDGLCGLETEWDAVDPL